MGASEVVLFHLLLQQETFTPFVFVFHFIYNNVDFLRKTESCVAILSNQLEKKFLDQNSKKSWIRAGHTQTFKTNLGRKNNSL